MLLAVESQATYQVYCNSSFQATPITSTFAEPRQDTGWSRPNRFHAGVDITGQCSAGATVKPIEGGKAYLGSAACEDQNACIRVVNEATGHAFDYEHVTPSVSAGATVTTATIIGTIQDLGTSTHLHLNEIIRVGNQNFRVNPQFQNRLDYLDNDRPTFVSVTVGSESDQVVIVQPGTESSPVTFRKRSGAYYVSGQAMIFATARNGSSRKGLYSVSSDADPIRLVGASAALPTGMSLGFNYLFDGASNPNDVQRIYWKRHPNPGGSITFIPTNLFLGGIAPQAASGRWDTALGFQGPQEVCATAVDHPQPNAHSDTTFPCVDVVVDNTGPTINMSNVGGTVADGGATSTAAITIAATDSGGIYSIRLEKSDVSYSSTNYVSGVQTSAQNTFPDSGVLSDGSYTATVVDLAGNASQAFSFRVDTAGPSGSGNLTQAGLSIPAGISFPSTATTGSKWTASSGVSTAATAGTVSTFSCVSNMISTVAISQMLSLSSGTYTSTATTCAGVTSTVTFTVTMGTRTLEVCVPGNCSGSPANGAAEPTSVTIVGQPLGAPDCSGYPSTLACFCDVAVLTPHDPGDCVFTGSEYRRKYTAPCSQPFAFTVSNSTDISWNLIMSVNGTGYGNNAGLDSAFPTPGNSVAGELHVPQTGAVCPSTSTATPGVSIWSKFWNLVLAVVTMVDDYLEAANKAGKGAFPGSTVSGTGSSVALGEGATIRYSLAWPSGMSISTQTLAIYQWDGAAWSSATVGGQYIYKDPTTSVLTASGTITYSGIYGLFYDAIDSSAPITTLSFQGSTRSFLTDVFVATDAYVVLIATDPTVNGYASTVATTYYRIDPTTSSPGFSVYTASVPLSLGFHIFEYRSVDWAGNYEPIKTSTFLVTAGTLFRASSRLSSRGSALMGFLDYGILLDVQSRAENALTLQISRANASPLVSADNIGDIGLGLSQMSARFDVQGGTPTLAALALRSGNSIASTSSVQIAFGYNGEPSMRHAITTTHSTDAVGNRMDFYVWNPLAPSTSSIASMDVLALQVSTITSGGVFHVRPVGNPIGGVELIVSDGVTPGVGTVLRADAQTHSSRALKSDIRLLTPKERAAAARDALTLKHSRFNYKSEPPGTAPHTGVMHEDAPASVRGPGGSVSLDARLLNLEVALQETAQRLKRLRERMRRLETR